MQWIGLGQGGANQMRNSNIFIIYADSTGSNVTLSPRLGTGEVEPKFNSGAQVSLVEGSGIANGVMTANVRCGCSLMASLSVTIVLASSLADPVISHRFGMRQMGNGLDGPQIFLNDLDLGVQKWIPSE